MTTSSWLDELAQHKTATALVQDGRHVSFSDVMEEIAAYRKLLTRSGISAGDVVILHADFSLKGIAALLALAQLKAITIPVVNLTAELVATLKSECSAGFLCRPTDAVYVTDLGSGGTQRLYDSLRERNTAGLVLVSSGTTGKPKAILHDFDRLLEARRRSNSRTKLTVLLFLLFDHIGGLNTLIKTLFSGGTAVVTHSRQPDVICGLIETHQVQVLPTSPTFLNLIILSGAHNRHDLSSLRLITYGTEPMPEELLIRAKEAFPKIRFVQTFGTSETGIAATKSPGSRSVLFKIDDESQQYRVVDGELQLKSRYQFLGYVNHPNNTITEDGWFRTGDAAEITADGYIRIHGRIKEIINVGGEKVVPLELEAVLLRHPMVADCIVYAMANAITGQSVWADVVPRGEITQAELRRSIQTFLIERVDRFKIPSRIRVVDQIEMSERYKKQRIRA